MANDHVGMQIRKDDFGISPPAVKHKEQPGISASGGNIQSKGITNQKGRQGGEIKRRKTDINFPAASDSQYKPEL